MPFKSEAQRKKLEQLASEGKISQETIKEFRKNSPEKLPERVTPKKSTVKKVKKI